MTANPNPIIMPLELHGGKVSSWSVRKIAVIGPGTVGMPMAALLAHARIREGSQDPREGGRDPACLADLRMEGRGYHAGRSPIGGVEPDLDRIVAETSTAGLLSVTHGMAAARDADVVLICVQTDKQGFEPDYGPLFEALPFAIARDQTGNIQIENTLEGYAANCPD